MTDPKLHAQLRIAEIDGELERLHAWLMDPIVKSTAPTLERSRYLRMETDLRRERQSLCAELGDG